MPFGLMKPRATREGAADSGDAQGEFGVVDVGDAVQDRGGAIGGQGRRVAVAGCDQRDGSRSREKSSRRVGQAVTRDRVPSTASIALAMKRIRGGQRPK